MSDYPITPPPAAGEVEELVWVLLNEADADDRCDHTHWLSGEQMRRIAELLQHWRPQPVAHVDVGIEWMPCVKLPITVHVRDQRTGETHSSTREGITPLRSDDLIMRGVQGEEYPIGRELFEQTYKLLPTPEVKP